MTEPGNAAAIRCEACGKAGATVRANSEGEAADLCDECLSAMADPPAAFFRLSPQFSRAARLRRATLCHWFGHKPDPFQGWFGPAGADDEDGDTFDLCICARCYVSLDLGGTA